VRFPQNVAIAKVCPLHSAPEEKMRILVIKSERKLYLLDRDSVLLRAPVGLGRVPGGAKAREGDGKTPEGVYAVCLVKPDGKYGRSLGLNFPNAADARAALVTKAIDEAVFRAIVAAEADNRRPPWGTALGGEIYIHEGGAHEDWTQGCIALEPSDMDTLFLYHPQITQVEIRP